MSGAVLHGCAPAQMRRGGYLNFIRPDQHPPLVGAVAAADSLWGPAAESERSDGIAESRRAALEALVRRFAPTLVLPENDHAVVNGRRYRIQPTDVALFTDTLRLDVTRAAPYAFEDSVDIAFGTLGLDSLAALVTTSLRYQSDPELVAVWYFDFPGRNPREWWAAYGRLRSGPDSARWATPTVYAHPFAAPDGRVAIQYWFFYPFNDFVGNHEGDWEHINVVLTPDGRDIAEVHYYFHARSIRLPQGNYRPEIVDGTHPVVYAGGRMYNVFDYGIRIFAGERNSGSHGNFPYPGEWEGAAGLGAPESVGRADHDSLRVVRHQDFRVVLTPEPSRIDFLRRPDGLRAWAWLLLPVRWGFPSVTSLGSEMKSIDVGNRAPFGPAFLTAWNRTAPGLLFPGFQVRRLSNARSFAEDLVQPWYYLYIFRTPRYVHDTRIAGRRRELEQLGLVPRSGAAERGFGTPAVGLHIAYAGDVLDAAYRTSTGFALWRNFWGKIRFGAVEVLGGYQKFPGRAPGASLFVYPFTAGIVLRAGNAVLRPYVTAGAGLYGWQTRSLVTSGADYEASSGWGVGGTAAAGVEYYLRPRVALDVGVRLHATSIDGAAAGLAGDQLRFLALWIGHYVRF